MTTRGYSTPIDQIESHLEEINQTMEALYWGRELNQYSRENQLGYINLLNAKSNALIALATIKGGAS